MTSDLVWECATEGRTWRGQIVSVDLEWEFQLLRNDELLLSQRFPTHDEALHEAKAQRLMCRDRGCVAETAVQMVRFSLSLK